MGTIQNIDNILLRDGTSQNDRNLDALSTDYVAIEGRSLEVLITEAQRLAKELQFFDEQNRPTGTWESFLIDDPNVFNQNSLEGRKIQQKQWARELAAYVENPELFYNNIEKKAKLSKPHVVLFITFLKLMNHVKSKMNGLTEKHLDFYYRKYLQLDPKQAVPDVVNVLLELEENTQYLEVEKGTILQAGEDTEGNELQYVTNEDTVISKAQITQLKSVFVSKQVRTIRNVHQERRKSKDAAFVDMMEMALGHPNPGDALPDFPEALQIEDLFQLEEAVKNENAEALAYVKEVLFLERDEFDRIFLKHQQDKEGIPIDWVPEYELLEKAYERKIIHQRQLDLKELHNTNGFDAMLKKVYGNPNPGDSLPLYNGETTSLEKVLQDLQASNENSEQALEYVEVELLLRKQDFIHVMQTNSDSSISEEDKNKVYRILEFSERQLRSVVIHSPETEQLSDIYDTTNAKDFLFSQYDEEEESKRFKTFGDRLTAIADNSLKPSEIGFAISSPTLLLKDGKRTIEVLLDLNLSNQKIEDLRAVFDTKDPFQTYLSSAEQWFTPDEVQYSLGNYVGSSSENNLNVEIKDQTITRLDTTNFTVTDIGDYIVDASQKIYEIVDFKDVKIVEIKEVGVLETPIENTQKYSKDQVYLNALRIRMKLQDNDLPIISFPSSSAFIASDYPVMVCTLQSSIEEEDDQNRIRSSYQHLVDVALQKAHIRVDVQEMQHSIVENDEGTIDTNKPFEPFGFQPEIGTSFYIANDEISQKRLQDVQLHLEWIKQPTSFVDYYKNYWLIQADHTEEELASLNDEQLAELMDQKLGFDAAIIENEHDFKADVFLHDRNAELLLSVKVEDEQGNEVTEGFPLFNKEKSISINDIPTRIKNSSPDYQYKERFGIQTDDEEALLWDRYFRIELTPINFQHSVFNTLSVKQAISEKVEIKNLKINPPYHPKLKKLGISYTSCDTILANTAIPRTTNKIFHIHPFGYDDITPGEESTLIPAYKDEGSLYLGITEANTPQVLSILFQMAEGSADPEIEKPVVQWSYLRNNEWITLAPSNLLQDGTNGLLNTGIVKIRIPEDATQGGTLMPSHLHWIKISTFKNIEGVSDTIDIRSQVISATLASETVAPVHFENPLPVDTISEELNQIPEVAKIAQPFTSSKGKPVEKGDALYKRISERLRHKNRALTMWDYEHMILHKFPEIYKTKCLPASDRIGGVDVIVVPDIKGKLPFNPFAPKVAADTLLKINSYLENLAPTYAEISVSNPSYLQVSTECVVKFYSGYDEVFYKDKLIEEIKRFMSPWAYGEDSEIQIGGSLHASMIINFIAERPYIDYVANLKLFQSEDGKTFTDVRSLNDGKSIVTPSQPDMIMVAAQIHEVYVVNENGFEEDSFEGINYMEISKDFIVK